MKIKSLLNKSRTELALDKFSSKGFTLIELLIIIAILGILAAGVVTAINPLAKINSANLAKAKTFSASVENSLIMSQVGKWSFEEGSGTTVKDTSGYGNNGTINGEVTWQTSSQCGLGFGGCMSFNGTNGYINAGNGASLNVTDAVTVEVWVKMGAQSTGWRYVTFKNYSYAFAPEGTSANTYTMAFYHYSSAGEQLRMTVNNVPRNEWHHFVATCKSNGGACYLYKDGVQVDSDTFPNNPFAADSGSPFLIGHSVYSPLAFIDEVRVYSQALLSFQIQQHYAQGLIRHQLALK